MKRKIIEISSAFLLICFSFYYTDKAVDIVRRNDPIMKEIMRVKEEYTTLPVDAVLMDNSVVPGYYGKTIDIDTSFQKMKQYGEFNESLFVFEEVEPSISVEDYYDRYIASGNPIKNSVALVFRVEKNDDITDIVNMLNEKNIQATFFIDGVWIENNLEEVYNLVRDDHEVEVLNYDNGYDELSFSQARTILQSITNVKGKYCYAEYDQKEVLELCEKEKMHTIIPTVLAKNYPYSIVKNKLTKGSIIGLKVTNTVKKELSTILNYINQKGYKIDTLEILLNEAITIEK